MALAVARLDSGRVLGAVAMTAAEEGPYFDDPAREEDRLRRVTEEWLAMKAGWDAALAEAERELRERTGDMGPWWRELLVWKDVAAGDDPEVDLSGSMESLPRHDATAAAAIVRRFGDELFSVTDIQKTRLFRVWDGRIWGQDFGEVRIWTWMDAFWDAYRRALMHMKLAIEKAADEAAASKKSTGGSPEDVEKTRTAHLKRRNDELKKHQMFYDRMGNTSGHEACAEAVAHVSERCRGDAEFDTVTELVVVRNGVLDLSVLADAKLMGAVMPEVELLAHSSSRAVTHAALAVDYAPNGGIGPEWARYIAGVLPVAAVRWHLQKILGSTLLGEPKDKLMVNLIGEADSGKSVLLEVLDDVLGDYCSWVDPEVFLEQQNGGDGSAPSPQLHALRKVKLAVTSEPGSKKRYHDGLLKKITGRDTLQTRGLNQNPIKWRPRFVLVVASNEFVGLSVSDQALTERIHVVRFPRAFRTPKGLETWGDIPVEMRADTELTERILRSEEERSGVLNWLLDGLRGYLAEGVVQPREVVEARGEMVEALSEPVQWLNQWIEEGRILRDVEGAPQYACVGASEALEWFNEGRPNPWGRNRFNKELAPVASTTTVPPLNKRNRPWRDRPNEAVFDRIWPSNWADLEASEGS